MLIIAVGSVSTDGGLLVEELSVEEVSIKELPFKELSVPPWQTFFELLQEGNKILLLNWQVSHLDVCSSI